MPDFRVDETPLVTLYALQACPHCKDVRRLLQERRILFQTIYVDLLVGDERNRTLRQLRRINPSVSFPTLLVGETTVVGYKKEQIEAALAIFREQTGR